MKRFVHIYHTVRSKFVVDAATDAEAIEKADKMLCGRDLLSGNIQFGMETPAMSVDLTRQLPVGYCYTAGAEDITGYLIDDVDDEGYENSRYLDAEGQPQPANCYINKAITPQERDTILAALRLFQRADEGTLPLYNRALDTFNEIKEEIAEDSGPALSAEQIDALCERINC